MASRIGKAARVVGVACEVALPYIAGLLVVGFMAGLDRDLDRAFSRATDSERKVRRLAARVEALESERAARQIGRTGGA